MIALLTFIFVMAVTSLLFGGWVVVTIARIIWRTMNRGAGPAFSAGESRRCMNPGCRSGNPSHARFCRRCGSNLAEAMPRFQQSQPQPRFHPASGASNGRGRQVARV